MTKPNLNELYDLQNDPDELNNIAKAKPNLVRQFLRRLDERFKEGKWLR